MQKKKVTFFGGGGVIHPTTPKESRGGGLSTRRGGRGARAVTATREVRIDEIGLRKRSVNWKKKNFAPLASLAALYLLSHL